jgi:tetratricopeptide (TPR) repeat protein
MLYGIIKSIFSKSLGEEQKGLGERIQTLLRSEDFVAAAAMVEVVPEPERLPEWEAWKGLILFHQKDFAAAERFFFSALRSDPQQSQAHNGLSMVYYERANYQEALAHAQFACALVPNNPAFLAQHGLALLSIQDYLGASVRLRQSLLLDPDNVRAMNNLGIALHAVGHLDQALRMWRKVLCLKPDHEQALANLRATGLAKVDDFSFESGQHFQRSDILADLEDEFFDDPSDQALALELAEHYLADLNLEAAHDVLLLALEKSPKQVDLLLLQADIAAQLQSPRRAEVLYEEVLKHDQASEKAHLGLSKSLADQGKYDQALIVLENLVSISDKNSYLGFLAAAQANACRYDEALSTCRKIEELHPEQSSQLAMLRALSFTFVGEFEEGKRWLKQVTRHSSSLLGSELFLGFVHLLHAEYQQGWQAYGKRRLAGSTHQRLLTYPKWLGQPLEGKRILLLAEQGLGDQVMFASCLSDVLRLNPSQVSLEANERIAKTIARSFPDIQVLPSSQKDFNWLPKEQEFDFYAHIGDLPGFFRNRVEDFPRHQGYLRADPERVKYWRKKLGPRRLLVGFSWRGGVEKTRRSIRSIELVNWLSIFRNQNVQFVNLQYGDVSEELKRFSGSNGLDLLDFPEAIADLDEFSAMVSALDLIVTVCNTTVHYAGSLNRPCWVLTPYVPEWRYGLSGESMPWYPSTKMYRQSGRKRWDEVLERVGADLEVWVDQSAAFTSG